MALITNSNKQIYYRHCCQPCLLTAVTDCLGAPVFNQFSFLKFTSQLILKTTLRFFFKQNPVQDSLPFLPFLLTAQLTVQILQSIHANSIWPWRLSLVKYFSLLQQFFIFLQQYFASAAHNRYCSPGCFFSSSFPTTCLLQGNEQEHQVQYSSASFKQSPWQSHQLKSPSITTLLYNFFKTQQRHLATPVLPST